MLNFLIVEDEKSIALGLADTIKEAASAIDDECNIYIATNIKFSNSYSSTMKVLKNYSPDIAVVDHDLAEQEKIDEHTSGVDVTKYLAQKYPNIQIVVSTGYATKNEKGKYVYSRYLKLFHKIGDRLSFYEKGGDDNGLFGPIKSAIRKAKKIILKETKELMALVPCESEIMKTLLNQVGCEIKNANNGKRGLIVLLGETGSGKTFLSRKINAVRQKTNKITDKCGWAEAILVGQDDDAKLRKLLFGYAKNAFTGANTGEEGLVGKAQSGTIFIDEIAEISDQAQVMLLDFIENGLYQKMGSTKTEGPSQALLILATNKDIFDRNKFNNIRNDFFYRIESHCFRVPSLSERVEDIIPVAEYVVEQKNIEHNLHGDRKLKLNKSTIMYLKSADSPFRCLPKGGVRNLSEIVKKAFNKALEVNSQQISPSHFPVIEKNTSHSKKINDNENGASRSNDGLDDIRSMLDLVESMKKQGKNAGEIGIKLFPHCSSKHSSRNRLPQWLRNKKTIRTVENTPNSGQRWKRVIAWYIENGHYVPEFLN